MSLNKLRRQELNFEEEKGENFIKVNARGSDIDDIKHSLKTQNAEFVQ